MMNEELKAFFNQREQSLFLEQDKGVHMAVNNDTIVGACIC